MKEEGQLRDSGFTIALHIISMTLMDAKTGNLASTPEVMPGFFRNLTQKCIGPNSTNGDGVSLLEILVNIKKGSNPSSKEAATLATTPLMKESLPVIDWIIKSCRELDASGVSASLAKGVDEDEEAHGPNKAEKRQKMSKRERRLAAAKARKAKIMKKMAAKMEQFAQENKEAIKRDKAKQAAKGDGLAGLVCIVCRTDNSAEALGLVAHVQSSAMMGVPYEQKAFLSGEQCCQPRHGDGKGKGLLVKFCGHAMHFMCRDTYFASLYNKKLHDQHFTGRNAIDVENGELVCPLCEAPANELVPIPDLDDKQHKIDTKGTELRQRLHGYAKKLKDPTEMKKQATMNMTDSLLYSIRSVDMAYRRRLRPRATPDKSSCPNASSDAQKPGMMESYTNLSSAKRPNRITQMLKPRETMGISCLLMSASAEVDTRMGLDHGDFGSIRTTGIHSRDRGDDGEVSSSSSNQINAGSSRESDPLDVSTSALKQKIDVEGRCATELVAALQALGRMHEGEGKGEGGEKEEGLPLADLLPLDVDAFRLVTLSAMHILRQTAEKKSGAASSSSETPDKEGRFTDSEFLQQAKLTGYQLRVTQALIHSIGSKDDVAFDNGKPANLHAIDSSGSEELAVPPPHSLKPLIEIFSKPSPPYIHGNYYFAERVVSYLLPFLRQMAILDHCVGYLDAQMHPGPRRSTKANGVGGDPGSSTTPIDTPGKREESPFLQKKREMECLTEELRLPSLENLFSSSKFVGFVENWLGLLTKNDRVALPFLRDYSVPRFIELPPTYNELFMALSDGGQSLRWHNSSRSQNDKKRTKGSSEDEYAGEASESQSASSNSRTARINRIGSYNDADSKESKKGSDPVFSQPAVCLLTGKLLEAGHRGKGALSKHTREISPNAGVFLLLRHTSVLLISDGYGFLYGSPYVDSHGEMDIELVRGHMLYLDQDRLQALEDLFRSQGVSQTVARLRMRVSSKKCPPRNHF